MYFAWRTARLAQNAEIKRQNEITKTRIDLQVKEIKEMRDTVSVLMGAILEDITKNSRDRIEKYRLERGEGEEGATTLDEARVSTNMAASFLCFKTGFGSSSCVLSANNLKY